MTASLQELVKFIELTWYRPVGLIAAVLVTLCFVVTTGVAYKTGVTELLTAALLLELGVAGSWLWSRRVPKTPKGRIGFLVGLTASEDDEALRLREDFVVPLEQLIRSGNTGHLFHFVSLRPHIAERLTDHEQAEALREKSRAHFILYGRVRLRTINKEHHHVIDLNGLVTHVPLPEEISRAFSQEFSFLLPNRVTIPTDNDLFSFEFRSEWTEIVARYVIGIAMAFSGAVDQAEGLYRDALDRIEARGRRFPIYDHLTTNIPLRISELQEGRAHDAHIEWVETHSEEALSRLHQSLGSIHPSNRDNPMVLALAAIDAFLTERDTRRALDLVRRAPKNCNSHVNEAFLLAYDGDLRGAARAYRKATRFPTDPKTLSQAKDFMCWVLTQEPERYQVLFCLGLLNRDLKGDNIQARSDFERFLAMADASKYTREVGVIEAWLQRSGDSPDPDRSA